MLLLKKATALASPTDCIFLASSPNKTFPLLSKQSTEGVVDEPKLFFIICGFPVWESILATAQKVVPKSIPTLIPICEPPVRNKLPAIRNELMAGTI